MNPAVRRGLRRCRQAIGDDPAWLPIVLRATPTGTARRLTDATQLVVEGFPRSGNTFAVFAVRHAEEEAGRRIVISSHVHTPSAVKAAVRLRLPTVVVVRPPLDTLVSLLVAAPHVRPDTAVHEWIHHHEEIRPHHDRYVVASFDDVTSAIGSVIARVNRAFGTELAPLAVTPATTAAVFAEVEAHHQQLHGGSEHLVPRPSAARAEAAAATRAQLLRPAHEHALGRAARIYRDLLTMGDPA